MRRPSPRRGFARQRVEGGRYLVSAYRSAVDRMRIAQIAPPWFPIPPVGYGGIERVVFDLTESLVAVGHEVILCAPAGSQTSARLVPTVPRPVGLNLTEAQKGRHFVDASRLAYRRALDLGAELIHDHTDYALRR